LPPHWVRRLRESKKDKILRGILFSFLKNKVQSFVLNNLFVYFVKIVRYNISKCMNSDTSKISFIPKNPLAHNDAFVVRRRPTSLISVLAVIIFFGSVAAYVFFTFYSNTLDKKMSGLTTQIQELQKSFDQPEIREARIFNSRAKLVHNLLDQHIAVTPLFSFLSENTTESIFYTKINFKRSDEKHPLFVELSGEAPSYASLAYQVDVLRQKNKELSFFEVEDISLTGKGSVGFLFKIAFSQEYLSYARQAGSDNTNESPKEIIADSSSGISAQALLHNLLESGVTDTNSLSVAPESDSSAVQKGTSVEINCEKPLVRVLQEDGSVVCEQEQGSSFAMNLELPTFLSWIKFW